MMDIEHSLSYSEVWFLLLFSYLMDSRWVRRFIDGDIKQV